MIKTLMAISSLSGQKNKVMKMKKKIWMMTMNLISMGVAIRVTMIMSKEAKAADHLLLLTNYQLEIWL